MIEIISKIIDLVFGFSFIGAIVFFLYSIALLIFNPTNINLKWAFYSFVYILSYIIWWI